MKSTETIFGLHPVRSMLERHPERVLSVRLAERRDDPRVRAIEELARREKRPVERLDANALKRLLGDVVHQGVAAEITPLPPWGEDELLGALQGATAPLLLALDGVQDPHNLGACLRTADAAGAHALIIPKDRAATLDSVARKVAAGAAEFIPVVSVTNLARTLEALRQRGVWIVGTDGEAAQTLYSTDLKRPLALILGAEGSGMRRLTREKCDFLVRIPMAGHMQSLNVSVAAGIALFEALRQRAG